MNRASSVLIALLAGGCATAAQTGGKCHERVFAAHIGDPALPPLPRCPSDVVRSASVGDDAGSEASAVDARFNAYKVQTPPSMNPQSYPSREEAYCTLLAFEREGRALMEAYRTLADAALGTARVRSLCRIGVIQGLLADWHSAAVVERFSVDGAIDYDGMKLRTLFEDNRENAIITSIAANEKCITEAESAGVTGVDMDAASARVAEAKLLLGRLTQARDRRRATAAICDQIVGDGSGLEPAMGGDTEVANWAWDLLARTASERLMMGDVAGAQRAAQCALLAAESINPTERPAVCASLRVLWIMMQDGAGMLTTQESVEAATFLIEEALRCDPDNGDARMILRQLTDFRELKPYSPAPGGGCAEP